MQMVGSDRESLLIMKLLKGDRRGGGVCSRSQFVDRGDELLLEVMGSCEAPKSTALQTLR